MANSVLALSQYFGVSGKEFRDFWASLTEAEKEYYRNAELR